MAALLVGITVMGVLASAALPVWRQAAQREREAELVFRGEQYARAIGLYQRQFAGAFPPSIELLIEQRFLRREYKDPMAKGEDEDGEFQVLYQNSQTALQPGETAEEAIDRSLSGEAGSSQERTGGAGRGRATERPASGQGTGAAAGSVGGGTSFTSPTSGSTFGAGGQTFGARGGVIGVVSKSKEESIRLYNGRDHYNEWLFVYTAVSNQAGVTGGRAGVGGQRGQAGQSSFGLGGGRRDGGRPQGLSGMSGMGSSRSASPPGGQSQPRRPPYEPPGMSSGRPPGAPPR